MLALARQSAPKSLLVYSAAPMAANAEPPSAPPTLVLDTNVVLDWLLFADPGVAAMAAAIEAGSVRWLACAAMREEFERTLHARTLLKWQPNCERLLSHF